MTLVRGDAGTGKPFAEVAKEAIDALNNVHYEATTANAVCKTLEDQVAQLKAAIAELQSVAAARDRTVSLLQAEIDAMNAKLAASERDRGVTQNMLTEMNDKHCSCEDGRKQLNSSIAELQATIQV